MSNHKHFGTGYVNGKPVRLELKPIAPGHLLAVDAADAFLRMRDAAIKDNIDLRVNTAFRDHDWQSRLWNKWIADVARWENTPESQRSKRRPLKPARPGYSNHQQGLAVDINRAPGDNPETAAYDSPVDLWLRKHAIDYNYHNTIEIEPWHWEYKRPWATT